MGWEINSFLLIASFYACGNTEDHLNTFVSELERVVDDFDGAVQLKLFSMY